MAIEVAHLASDRVPTGLCEFETVFGFLYQAHLDEEVEVFLARWQYGQSLGSDITEYPPQFCHQG
jgi:hypothetical protein